MGYTALGSLQPEQKRHWINESIRVFRENFFFKKMMGKGENNIIQTINKLKRTEKGDRAMIGLVQDMKGTGIVGDNDIDGRREALESDWMEIHTDQLRNGVTSKGRVDDQQSIFDFRTESRDKLAYWRAMRQEELIILAASGISFAYNTDGSARTVGAQDPLTDLAFAADVAAPSSKRHYNFTAGAIAAGDTSTIASTSVPVYGMLVDLMAEAKTKGIKPLRVGGKEYYHYLCHPKTFARLKKDDDFRNAIINAAPRSNEHPIFTGSTVTVDGLIIDTNTRVYNTSGAASGSKWGATGTIDGTRSLLMGCQAIGHADLWGSAEWYEGKEDDDAKSVISIAMYFGVRKMKFASRYDSDTEQDFGVMAINLAL